MSTIFLLVILFCVWFRYEKNKSMKLAQTSKEEFLEREKNANIARKKDISNLDYITIPFMSLPTQKGDDEVINEYIDTLISIAKHPIVNLSKFSNTDLKLQYGAANFDILCEYDENYYSLLTLLANWGCYLYEVAKPMEALQVLEYAVSIGADQKVVLLTLAKIYADQTADEKLEQLKTHILDTLPRRSKELNLCIEKIRYHEYFS